MDRTERMKPLTTTSRTSSWGFHSRSLATGLEATLPMLLPLPLVTYRRVNDEIARRDATVAVLLNGKCLAASAKRNARMSPPGTGSRGSWRRIEGRAEIQCDGGVFCIISASRYLDMIICLSDVFGKIRL